MSASEEGFVSILDEESQKRACEELNEKISDRGNSVRALRDWMKSQKWIKTPTDYEYLLRYLRARKHSQLLARQTLTNYWTSRTKCPAWFKNVDPADPDIQAIIRTGIYFSPKKLTKDGRRIIFQKQGNLSVEEIKKYGVEKVYKAMMCVVDWINRDENVQVNGIEVFIDQTGLTTSHSMALWNIENGRRVLDYYQNSLPARTKFLYCYNEPVFFSTIWNLMTPFMKEKTKSRFKPYGRNLQEIHKKIDMSVLPEEYLPDDYEGPTVGPSEKIVADMIEDMLKPDFRNYIKDLSSGKYYVDLKRKPEEEAPAASFRKLTID